MQSTMQVLSKAIDRVANRLSLIAVRPGAWAVTLLMVLSLMGGGCKPSTQVSVTRVGLTQYQPNPILDQVREGFKSGMAEAGYVEGKNVVYEFESADGDVSKTVLIARKFVSDRLELIFAIATPSAQAAAKATATIPIVFGAITDPVSARLVNSLKSSGNNLTGTSDVWPVTEQLELLREIVPNLKTLGVVHNPGEANSVATMQVVRKAAKGLALKLVEAPVTSTGEVLQAARSLVGRCDAMYIPADNTAITASDSMIKVAEEVRLPLLAGDPGSVEKGALATLSINYYDIGKLSAALAVKILKDGKKPADIPTAIPRNYDLIVNLQAAKRMGVTVPEAIIARAQKVIR